MQGWLELFKFPSVERTTYDRCECTARNQVYPLLGDKTVGDITSADIKALLNHFMNEGYTKPVNFRKRYYRILKAAGIERKGLHSLRHTFATNLVNGVKQADGSIKSLTPKQVADLLGHSTSQITELYYVKKDTARLNGITDGFNL